MDFALTSEHEMIRTSVRDFAENVLKPKVADRDEREYFDRQVFTQLGELGLTGIPFEEAYGGSDMGYIAYAIAVEELGRVDPSAADTLSSHVSLGAWPIYKYGTEEQKQKFLVPLATGEKIGAFGLTEPNAGSDAMGMTCKAVLEGENYILNGRKIFITNAEAADTYIVFARTGPADLRSRAFSAFIVEKGSPGFTLGNLKKRWDCAVPKTAT